MTIDLNGYYDAVFTHNGNQWGTGQVKLRDGHLWGTDQQFVYEGQYAAHNGGWTTTVTVHQIAPDAISVFSTPGMEEFVIALRGVLVEEKLLFSGTVSQSDFAEIVIGLTKVADL